MKMFAEKRQYFPDPRMTFEDGIVAMGDDLEVEILLEAYSFGIFPWPHDELPVLWFCPDPRAVLEFDKIHISKSLQKFLNKTKFTITYNQNFSKVMDECSKVLRPGQFGTWISPPMKVAYKKFHESGYAHSIECWDGDELVGGLYGVYVGGVFSGESMFYKKTNASKFCIIKLTEMLKKNGLEWMDIQQTTPHMQKLGSSEISRDEFLRRLENRKSHLKSRCPQGEPLSFE